MWEKWVREKGGSTLRVFDILDVLAIIVGGFTSLVIVKLAIDKQLTSKNDREG